MHGIDIHSQMQIKVLNPTLYKLAEVCYPCLCDAKWTGIVYQTCDWVLVLIVYGDDYRTCGTSLHKE